MNDPYGSALRTARPPRDADLELVERAVAELRERTAPTRLSHPGGASGARASVPSVEAADHARRAWRWAPTRRSSRRGTPSCSTSWAPMRLRRGAGACPRRTGGGRSPAATAPTPRRPASKPRRPVSEPWRRPASGMPWPRPAAGHVSRSSDEPRAGRGARRRGSFIPRSTGDRCRRGRPSRAWSRGRGGAR